MKIEQINKDVFTLHKLILKGAFSKVSIDMCLRIVIENNNNKYVWPQFS